MTAHFKVKEIGLFSLEQWPVTVCAWRGCCIEVFARAEHSVAECLRALEKAGVTLAKGARSPAPVNRLRGLRETIGRHDFGGHGKAAIRRIDEWGCAYETRAYLAHGQIKAIPDGVEIDLLTFDGKAEKRLPLKHLNKLELLEALAEIEQAQRQLHNQLGQIRALVPTAKPIAASNQNPGSSPG